MRSVSEVLKDNNFRFNKQFGQNFITDTNLLASMVQDANITNEDIVVEIGPGAGTLTREIAKVAKKVYAFEIDKNLVPILNETLQDVLDKVEVIFKDIQKVSENELNKLLNGQNYKVVANLPYYITTPIIMKFLESDYKPQSITIMVQKEVADRLTSKANDPDFGAITLAINLEGEAIETRFVSRQMFMPPPNVDSTVVRIDILDKYKDVDKKKVKKIIKAAFCMRRKTLVNNLSNSFKIPKEEIIKILEQMNLDSLVRGETLDINQYIKLSTLLNIGI
jgi:16S rRNA (adenine1518-N6/adenine1519-N6)-dimethyltransferase